MGGGGACVKKKDKGGKGEEGTNEKDKDWERDMKLLDVHGVGIHAKVHEKSDILEVTSSVTVSLSIFFYKPNSFSTLTILNLELYTAQKKFGNFFHAHNFQICRDICSFSVIYQCKADVFIFTMVPNLKHSLVPVRSYLPENMGRSQSECAKIKACSQANS